MAIFRITSKDPDRKPIAIEAKSREAALLYITRKLFDIEIVSKGKEIARLIVEAGKLEDADAPEPVAVVAPDPDPLAHERLSEAFNGEPRQTDDE